MALANPASTRLLATSLRAMGVPPQRCLGGAVIATVGPATATASAQHGVPADLVAAGRRRRLSDALCDLVESKVLP